MKEVKIGVTANPNEKDKKNTLTAPVFVEPIYDMPETVQEAVASFGEEVCLSKIISAVKVDFQAFCRTRLQHGIPADDLQLYIENVNAGRADAPITPWKPGVAPMRTDSAEKKVKDVKNFFAGMSDKEILSWLKEHRQE